MTREINIAFDLELPPVKTLHAGSLTCLYEAGNLRYIMSGETELVRKIYAAVRFENWDTIPYRIEDEELLVTDNGFTIRYTAIYGREKDIYIATFLVEGRNDNSISFSMEGTALESFKKNRIGLCLLHPLKECRGRNITVLRPDGSSYQSIFPMLVSASLPFIDIRQLEWVHADNMAVEILLEGDIFETEDQRNWADGSYKTYSTPHTLPKPVVVQAGDKIKQRVLLKVTSSKNYNEQETGRSLMEKKIPFPQIGYCRSEHTGVLNEDIVDHLLKIPFDHYRVSIFMNDGGWISHVTNALAEAFMLHTKLELFVFFTEDFEEQTRSLIALIREHQLLIRSIVPIQHNQNISSPGLLHFLYPVIKQQLPAVTIGYGTDGSFVDLNEQRPEKLNFDFLSFGLQPQAHAFDNRTIFENLQSQSDLIETAISFAMGQPVCISPVTLRSRGAGPDERQHSSMTAFWTLLSLQNLGKAFSTTFYEIAGPGGILVQNEMGEVSSTPVYEALLAIKQFQPVWIVKRWLGSDLLMDGLLLEDENGDRLFFKGPGQYVMGIRHELIDDHKSATFSE